MLSWRPKGEGPWPNGHPLNTPLVLLHKNWPGGGELLLQNVPLMITPTNHVNAQAGFTLNWTLALWDFCNIFLPNTGEDQKKSYMKGVYGC